MIKAHLWIYRQKIDLDSPVMKLFDGFREELDEKHDRNERIVKLSRDVTIGNYRWTYRPISLETCACEELTKR